jgi:hypothetical protein
LPHLSANIPSGSEVPSWLHCPPSNRCESKMGAEWELW